MIELKLSKSNIVLYLLVHGYMLLVLLTLFIPGMLTYLFGAHSLNFSGTGFVAFENTALRIASLLYYVIFVISLCYAYINIILKRNFKFFLFIITVDVTVSVIILLSAMIINLYIEILNWLGILISIIYIICLRKVIKQIVNK